MKSKTLHIYFFENDVTVEIHPNTVHINNNYTGITVSKSNFFDALEWIEGIQTLCQKFPRTDTLQLILNKISDLEFTDWSISFYSVRITDEHVDLLFDITCNSECLEIIFPLPIDMQQFKVNT